MKSLALAALVAGCAAWAAPSGAAAPDQQETRQSWENYRIKARQELDVVGDKIAALETKAKSEKTKAREELQAQTAAMRARKADAERLLGRISTATEDARRNLRTELDDALRALKESIHKAETESRDRS